MRREIGDYIRDILEAMTKCEEFIEGLSFDEFISDDKTVFAAIRAIEVIGEAVKNLPDDIKNENTEIPWKNMAGMRDKLIHNYFGADVNRIWKTVKEEIPSLKPFFKKILDELENR